MCCHCLLIEGEDGFILVDSGLGVEDVADPKRLGGLFTTLVRPRLEVAETALRQVADLGFRIDDVRHIVPTHLDLDHAGGFADFPAATVHVYADELRAAGRRCGASACAIVPPNSILSRIGRRSRPAASDWFGFKAVRAMPGTQDDMLLVPLPGHSRGHCGVAMRTASGWLLHCGDAYFHHAEVAAGGGTAPIGIRAFELMVNVDKPARGSQPAAAARTGRAPRRRGEAHLVARPGRTFGLPRVDQPAATAGSIFARRRSAPSSTASSASRNAAAKLPGPRAFSAAISAAAAK